ncbi:MAG: hypothetical protein KIT61_05675 [Pyrinomonadaceae bacterium]|jgi:hypothetical protein|nr:hypothetical protein [Blastocatellia bacterium]MCW5956054.1 hypothetical protein [Pyrinomonadaceae bacterium]
MATKISALVGTLLINLLIGIAVFFVLIITLNGYSESDATYAIISYIVLGLVVTLMMSLGAFLTVGFLTKRQYSGVLSVIIAIVVFSVIGALLKAVCGFIGVGVAELVRVNF